jgi:MATE family multidrug resistance protein
MNREILRLAIPNIISNVSVPLLSTVDTALMGRLSELHIGAVGIGSMIFNFVYWNFGFLRMGTTGLTAQAFGRRDDDGAAQTLGRALLLSSLIAALVLLLQSPLGRLSFWLMNVAEGPQQALVADYFFVRVWAAPATLALYAFIGWFFGMQNAIFPLVLTVAVNALNIVVSYVLVRGYGLEARGVAWGTVIAEYAGLLLATALFYRRYGRLLPRLRQGAVLRWRALRSFLAINADIFLRTFCLTFAFGFFYSRSAAAGELALAANVILLQYLNWLSYGVDGFAFASEALVGKYAGARDRANTLRAVRFSFAWGLGLALLFSLTYGLAGEVLLRVFTNQRDVVAAAVPFLFWMTIFPIFNTPCYLWDGVFIGLTASRAMRNSMILALGVFLLAYYLLFPRYGNQGLWLALLLFMAARGAVQTGMYARWGIALR